MIVCGSWVVMQATSVGAAPASVGSEDVTPAVAPDQVAPDQVAPDQAAPDQVAPDDEAGCEGSDGDGSAAQGADSASCTPCTIGQPPRCPRCGFGCPGICNGSCCECAC